MTISWSKLRVIRGYAHWVKLYRRQYCSHHTIPYVQNRDINLHTVKHLGPRKAPIWSTEATLYVHWPYCEKRCTYCNFNKYISQSVDQERMKKCLLTETRSLVDRSYVSKINSIFFGGGTPSLAPPSTIEAIILLANDICHLPDGAEITLEANPTSTEMKKLRAFKEAGVNRVSIGLQALTDRDLKVLGRQHSVQEALRCLDQAKLAFPGKTSVDLIFGRPGQTVDMWQKELEKVLELCDDHISLYQLTLERGTHLFKQVSQGSLTLPSSEEMADMYECTVDMLETAGFCRYEASNFARKGAESSHNKNYWRGSQYIGVGPGAHGRFVLGSTTPRRRWAFTQTLEPGPWMVEVERDGHATRRAVPQLTLDILEEILMLGLRTVEGVPEKRWQLMGSVHSLSDILGSDRQIQAFVDEGLLHLDHRGIRATRSGLNVIDAITPYLLYALQEYVRTKDSETNFHMDI